MRASLRAHRERPWLRIEVAGEREGRVRKPRARGERAEARDGSYCGFERQKGPGHHARRELVVAGAWSGAVLCVSACGVERL